MTKLFVNKKKYTRNLISVKLADGQVVMVSNRANKEKISFSEAVRRAIKAGLGL